VRHGRKVAVLHHLRPSDLIRLNRQLVDDSTIGDPDAEMPGVDWKRLRDACDRHQGKVEVYPDTVYERGAVLFDSLISNEPFQRMNRETAVLALYAFAGLNGFELDLSSGEFLAYIEEGRLPGGSARLAVWLGHRANPIG
jgi:prophage maintenance system killer protein